MNDLVKKSILSPTYQGKTEFSLDRNIAFSSDRFYTAFEEDASLVIGIICFIQQNISQFERERDLFDNEVLYIFDLAMFANFYDTTIQYLYKKHPHPLRTGYDGSIHTTLIGNALYKLKDIPINDIYHSFDISRNMARVKEEKPLFFLEVLDITYSKTKVGTKKVKIKFKLNEVIEVNVFKLFDRVNKNVLTNPAVRKNKIDSFYLYISMAKNVTFSTKPAINRFTIIPKQGSALTPFDFLSKLLCVDKIKDFNDRKIRMQEKVKLLNKITEDPITLGFDPSSTGKSKNQPFIIWEKFVPYTVEQINEMHVQAFNELFLVKLKRQWSLYHMSVDNVERKKTFEQWVADTKYDVEFKISAYIEATAIKFNKKITPDSKDVILYFGTPEQITKLKKDEFYGRLIK
jgi:hypothetical protein